MKLEKIGMAESRSAARLGKIGMAKSVKMAMERHSATLSPEMEIALKNHKKARYQYVSARQYKKKLEHPDFIERVTHNHEWAVRKANIALRHDFNNVARSRLPEHANPIDIGADLLVRAGLFTKGVTIGIGVGIATTLWMFASSLPVVAAMITGQKKQEERRRLRAQYGGCYLIENIGAGALADVKRSYKLAGLGTWEKHARKIKWQRREVDYGITMLGLKEGQSRRNYWEKNLKKYFTDLDGVMISHKPPQLPPLPKIPQIEL